MWALKYSKCKKCCSNENPHISQGLCSKCYYDMQNKKNRYVGYQLPIYGQSVEILTYEFIIEMYYEAEMSLREIAKVAKCTPQFVSKQMRKHGIVPRSKSKARKVAYKKEKIIVDGRPIEEIKYNELFFKKWSEKMAYVLGVIYTDGNLFHDEKNKTYRITIAQKEPEILEKIVLLFESNMRILKKTNNKDDYIFYIQIYNKSIYEDLLCLGLTPNKSLSVKYPVIPEEHESHFIRGLWDGDGSVYITDNKAGTSFVSGSMEFIEVLYQRLNYYGIEVPKINKYKNAYYLRITRKEPLMKFRDFLYSESTDIIRMKRKYDKFMSFNL